MAANAVGGLGADKYRQQWTAKKVGGLLDFLPGVGEAVGVDEAKQDYDAGNYGMAAAGLGLTAAGLAPGIGDAVSKVGKQGMRAFHGSPHAKAIEQFRPSWGGELGRGVYFSRDEQLASGYKTPRDDKPYPDAGVVEMDLSRANIKDLTRKEWLAIRSKLYDEEQAANDGDWTAEVATRAERRLEELFKSQGYDGIYDDTKQGIVFPDRAHLIDIVRKYGIAGAVSAGLISQQTADEMEAQGLL